MEPGEKCVCQENSWWNCFGEKSTAVHRGMRLTVIGSMYVAGTRFYSFKETPEDNFFMGIGFKPMRQLN